MTVTDTPAASRPAQEHHSGSHPGNGGTDTGSGGRLAKAMADVARQLQPATTIEQTWHDITRLATQRLDHVEHAGITVLSKGRPETPASSDDLPAKVDELQYETGQGPCLDALLEHDTFVTGDLAAETTRWPDFAPRAADTFGIHSMLSFQLFVGHDTLGALNLYSSRRDAFDDSLIAAGAVFAAHAAVAAANAQQDERADNLETALQTSRAIGTAMGILMAYHKVTERQAFELLRGYSQNSNRRLRDVADDVVATGALPAPVPSRRRLSPPSRGNV